MRAGLWVQRILLGVVSLVVAYLALVPLYFLISETFFADDSSGVDAFRRAFSVPGASRMIYNSLVFSIGSAVLAIVLGTVLAYLFVRTDAPFKPLCLIASVVPIIVPGVLNAIIWVFVASSRIGILKGPINFFHLENTIDVFSMGGMIFVQGTHLSPLVFLLMIAVFRSMDPSFEEAALMSGAGLGRTLARVTLPLSLPALLGAGLIVLVQSLENFEVPAVLGLQDRIFVFTSRIYYLNRQFPPDLAAIGAISLTVIVLAALGIIFSRRIGGEGQERETITGKAFRPRPVQLSSRGRKLCGSFIVAYFFVVVVLPFIGLIYASLLPFFRPPSTEVFGDFTLENYRLVFSNESNTTAWQNTAILALGSAVVVTLLGALAAWIIVRSRTRGRHVLEQLGQAPLAIPGLILGLAIAFAYLRLPGGIYGTLLILLIAYVTRFLPYGLRYAVSSMVQVGRELEESAAMSGATWWYTMRRVVLPLIAPGLLSAFIFVLVISFRELSASLLLYSPGNEVLPVRMFQMYEDGQLPQVAALGVVLVVVLTAIVGAAYKLGSNIGIATE